MSLPVENTERNGGDTKPFEVNHQNKKSEKPFVCIVCEKEFQRKASLTVHMNSHNSKKGLDDCLQHEEKEIENACSICYKRFTAKKNLLKHLRDVHKNFKEAERMVVKKIKCPETNCNFICRMMKELRDHIQEIHKIKILKDTLEFPNETVFQSWKKEEETNTVSWFVTGRKKTTLIDGTKKQILYCHRTGQYSPKGFGKYRMRSVGSCKIGVTCPASMEVVEASDGQLSVVYYKTHLGHVQDVVYLKLSREERANLAEKIEQGFTFDSILEDVKESIDKNNLKTKRIHLLSKKDLYSIMRSSHCNQGKKTMKRVRNEGPDTEERQRNEDDHGKQLCGHNLTEEKLANRVHQNFTLYPGEGVILPQEYSVENGNLIAKSSREASDCFQVTTDRISPQIVILSRDIDMSTSVAEIILLSAAGDAVVPAKIMPDGTETALPPALSRDENKKINKMHLRNQLKGKLDRINDFLPQSEFLTPKQFALIGHKLDAILNLLTTADAKAKSKGTGKRKSYKKEKPKNIPSIETNEGIG